MKHILDLLEKCTGFEWDAGNSEKNWKKHKVSSDEAEQVFASDPLKLADDIKHSENEPRFLALGKTKKNRLLSIAFTVRVPKIRVISARPMSEMDKIKYGSDRT
jgi:uncharacterized protein